MAKKVFSIIIALTLILILALGITACTPADTADQQNQNSNTEVDGSSNNSDVSDSNQEKTLVTISQVASDQLKNMISDGDYSEEVFLRVEPVRGGGWGGPRFQVVLDESTDENDTIIEYDGIRIVYKLQYESYVLNTVIDYSNKIFDKGFILRNQPPSDC